MTLGRRCLKSIESDKGFFCAALGFVLMRFGARTSDMDPRANDHTYHHGNLQSAALEEALKVVRQGDPNDLSIRALAGTLGVAHRAIYNHYKDRTALLRAVAAKGFEELGQAMSQAEGKIGIITTYCRFALANQGLYRTMMSTPNLAIRLDSTLAKNVDSLLHIIAKQWSAGGLDDLPSVDDITRLWLILHGGLTLYQSKIWCADDEMQLLTSLSSLAVD
jgi:AcrR family transcriptional regulator